MGQFNTQVRLAPAAIANVPFGHFCTQYQVVLSAKYGVGHVQTHLYVVFSLNCVLEQFFVHRKVSGSPYVVMFDHGQTVVHDLVMTSAK